MREVAAARGDRAWPMRSRGTSSRLRSFRNRQRSFTTVPGSARTCGQAPICEGPPASRSSDSFLARVLRQGQNLLASPSQGSNNMLSQSLSCGVDVKTVALHAAPNGLLRPICAVLMQGQ